MEITSFHDTQSTLDKCYPISVKIAYMLRKIALSQQISKHIVQQIVSGLASKPACRLASSVSYTNNIIKCVWY